MNLILFIYFAPWTVLAVFAAIAIASINYDEP